LTASGLIVTRQVIINWTLYITNYILLTCVYPIDNSINEHWNY